MAKYTATVEQASDGSWSALAVIGDYSFLGDGDTRQAAIDSLCEGIAGEAAYLKSKGQTLPAPTMEVVSIEVAA